MIFKGKNFFFGVLLLIQLASGVDRSNFKSCEQSSFCRRCRKMEREKSTYELDLSSLSVGDNGLQVHMINTDNSVQFLLHLIPLKEKMVRLRVEELTPLRRRFVTPYVLVQEPTVSAWTVVSKSDQKVELLFPPYKIILNAVPFRIDVTQDGKPVMTVNTRGLFRFEHTQQKPEERDEGEDPGAWEENYKSHHDSKPHGPTAVASDFTFHGAKVAYGLPEHADSLALKTTTHTDPYRFYNLDVFEYELNSPMSLYAAIPLLVAHSEQITTGVFWLNPSETWVDVSTNNDNMVSSIVNFVGGQNPEVETHFMSESGNVDVFLLLGGRPLDVMRQYTLLTGTAPVPPLFSLGYHQCRWNYNDQDDVNTVSRSFDDYDLPMDAMWLDIEHTDGKKYFTWDAHKFSDPIQMQHNLTARGRKLVVINDPHIKREGGFFIHEDATNNGYYVKDKSNNDYEGWCWPGSSSYLDFLNPTVRAYYSSKYKLTNYITSTEDLHIWNDMNEPSVFNGPEVTMPKDCLHHEGWEHREIHNIYGFLHTMSTYEGLLHRADVQNLEDTKRPFILTRSAFSGSQRFTAIWTGDNDASWGHLQATIPMCLSLAIGGMSFCGSDVGGFFHNPEPELLIRWYQMGAFIPFYRGHAHIDTKRREPWLFPDTDVLPMTREALKKRYSFLPLWYTLFYQHNRTGDPVIRPLWTEFPDDEKTFKIEDQLLVGSSILARPVLTAGATHVSVYFPGKRSVWYDIDTYEKHGPGHEDIPVSISSMPAYYQGGTIVPRKMRVRRSSVLMTNDPYTFIVALDPLGEAEGYLYIDDGVTHRYHHRKDSSVYMKYKFSQNTLSSEFASEHRYNAPNLIERIIVVGLKPGTYSASIVDGDQLETLFSDDTDTLTIRKPGVRAASKWQIKIK